MHQNTTPKRNIDGLGLLAAAVIAKTVVLAQLADHPLLQEWATPDSNAYVVLAQRVVAGDWLLGPGAYFVSPLYIYFVAVVSGLTGSLFLVKVTQVGLGACTVWLVWWMTRAWCSNRAGLIAGTLTIATGVLTFYEVSFLQASLDPFLTACTLSALTAALIGRGQTWFATTGALFGVLLLNRPNVVVAAVGVLAVLAVYRQWRPLLLLVTGLLLALLPVGVRNLAVTGELSLLPSHGGLNFYIGNGPGATGLYRQLDGIRANIDGQAVDARLVAERATRRSLSDREVSRFFTDNALEWALAHPGSALMLLAKKVYYTLHGQHFAVPLSLPFFAYDTDSWLGSLAVGPWLLVSLGMVGLFDRWKIADDRMAPTTWLVIMVTLVFSVALFFVTERYRIPLVIPLLVGSGIALDQWLTLVRLQRWRSLLIRFGAVTAGLVVFNWPLDLIDADGRREERLKMAEVHARAGDIEASNAWMQKALDVYPYPQAAHLRLATILAAADRTAPALAHLRSAAATPTDADDPDVWLQAGRLAMRLRAPDVGVLLFRRAVAQLPQDPAARDQYALALMLSGDLLTAGQQFRTVVDLDASNVDAWAHLAYVEAQVGSAQSAVLYARRALTLQPSHDLAGRILRALEGR